MNKQNFGIIIIYFVVAHDISKWLYIFIVLFFLTTQFFILFVNVEYMFKSLVKNVQAPR